MLLVLPRDRIPCSTGPTDVRVLEANRLSEEIDVINRLR